MFLPLFLSATLYYQRRRRSLTFPRPAKKRKFSGGQRRYFPLHFPTPPFPSSCRFRRLFCCFCFFVLRSVQPRPTDHVVDAAAAAAVLIETNTAMDANVRTCTWRLLVSVHSARAKAKVDRLKPIQGRKLHDGYACTG